MLSLVQSATQRSNALVFGRYFLLGIGMFPKFTSEILRRNWARARDWPKFDPLAHARRLPNVLRKTNQTRQFSTEGKS